MPLVPREPGTGSPTALIVVMSIVALSAVGVLEFGLPHSLLGWCLLPLGGIACVAFEALAEFVFAEAHRVLFVQGLVVVAVLVWVVIFLLRVALHRPA
jgi:hypothetical protein